MERALIEVRGHKSAEKRRREEKGQFLRRFSLRAKSKEGGG